MKTSQQIARLRARLLRHYDEGGRALPWRIRPEDRARGVVPDPYAVWLSEIMLQQTTVAHATPYWTKFLSEFPTVSDLAGADRDRVLTLWAGLGYYARARNLHKCAQIVRDAYGGEFPKTEKELLTLPGIGAYSAAAIAAICYNEPTNVVDGNVERVISRLLAVESPLPKAKAELRALAGALADPKRPGDYAQAIMDLGARVCRPKNPDCGSCVWAYGCAAKKAGNPLDYPRKIKKAKAPIRYGAVFVLSCGDYVLIRKRPDKGLLGGMMEFPGSEWSAKRVDVSDWMKAAPSQHNWKRAEQGVSHVFTHFTLQLSVFTAQTPNPDGADGIWVKQSELDRYALPSLMVKVAKAGLE